MAPEALRKSTQWNALLQAIQSEDLLASLNKVKWGPDDKKILPINSWEQTTAARYILDRTLQSLHFNEISDRVERVAAAHEKTFEWIFNPYDPDDKRWDSFTGWLEGPADLYWITGKAGSGKSTLMKYIIGNPQVKSSLSVWSRGLPIITASFFFWNSGTEIQMSQLGLLRSLFHQILTQRRLMPSQTISGDLYLQFLSRDIEKPWSWTELMQGLRELLHDETSAHYLLFIDGLDEFSGDLTDMIDLVTQFSKYPRVKLCVSSRPWVVFEDAYKSKPSLRMEDLTHSDIKAYISSKFKAHTAFVELTDLNPYYGVYLTNQVATKASGVFLWVVLAVRSLLNGFSNGDKEKEIKERLDSLPPDLETFYDKILDNIEPRYKKHAARLFQIFSAFKSPPTVLCMTFADDGVEEAIQKDIGPFIPTDLHQKVWGMKRRLNSRCKGLLEIGPVFTGELSIRPRADVITDRIVYSTDLRPLSESNVQYLHRTVKDFFARPEIQHRIVTEAGSDFNPNLCLYASYLQQLKSIQVTEAKGSDLFDIVSWSIEYAARAQGSISQAEFVSYLDEVDRAGSAVFRVAGGSEPLSTNSKKNWTERITHTNGTTFLSVAVICNFTEYVTAKLSDGMRKEDLPSRPLLLSAAMDYKLWKNVQPQLHLAHSEPSSKMVKLLLDHGFDPYEKYEGTSTPWDECMGHTQFEGEEWRLIINHLKLWRKRKSNPVIGKIGRIFKGLHKS